VFQGLLVGSVLGAFVAVRFANDRVKLLRLAGIRRPRLTEGGLATGFGRGVVTARFVCVFLGIPFTVFSSIVFCCFLSIMAVVIDGVPAGIEVLSRIMGRAVWLCGLYLHVVLFVAIVFLLGQCLGRVVVRLARCHASRLG
jgi:choline-glycine betaine transporter